MWIRAHLQPPPSWRIWADSSSSVPAVCLLCDPRQDLHFSEPELNGIEFYSYEAHRTTLPKRNLLPAQMQF